MRKDKIPRQGLGRTSPSLQRAIIGLGTTPVPLRTKVHKAGKGEEERGRGKEDQKGVCL